MEPGMPIPAHRPEALSAVRVDLGAIFVSMELSQSKWLITSLSPGNGEKLSKFIVAARDVVGMLARFADLQRKAQVRVGQKFPLVVIQEAGLDGFWIHRVLEAEGIESHIVDAFSPLPPERAVKQAHCSSPSHATRPETRSSKTRLRHRADSPNWLWPATKRRVRLPRRRSRSLRTHRHRPESIRSCAKQSVPARVQHRSQQDNQANTE
jgi:hypothetical protein